MWTQSLNDWELAPLELYKIAREESDKRLAEVIGDAERITNRAYAILGFLVTGITVAAGYTIKMKETYVHMNFMELCALLALVLLIRCLFLILPMINSQDIYRSGTEPKEVVNSAYFEAPNLDNQQQEKEKCLYLFIIEQNQEKITKNEASNAIRVKLFEDALLYLVAILCLFIFAVICNAL